MSWAIGSPDWHVGTINIRAINRHGSIAHGLKPKPEGGR
jgi:hypothetical protein